MAVAGAGAGTGVKVEVVVPLHMLPGNFEKGISRQKKERCAGLLHTGEPQSRKHVRCNQRHTRMGADQEIRRPESLGGVC